MLMVCGIGLPGDVPIFLPVLTSNRVWDHTSMVSTLIVDVFGK